MCDSTQMEATALYFTMELFSTLYNVVLIFEIADEIQS